MAEAPTDIGRAASLRKQAAAIRWWHSIDLGDGVVTPGHKSPELLASELASLELPPLSGRTVLDIGAWDGFFSFAAERLGAQRVVALDHYTWSIDLAAYAQYVSDCAQAGVTIEEPHLRSDLWRPDELPGRRGFELAHRELDSRVEPLVDDFLTLDLQSLGQFDVVLYLGVIYHMANPLGALRRLARVTAEMAIIETEARIVPGYEDVPLCEFVGDDRLNYDPTSWWFPNFSALRDLCMAAGFAEVRPTRPIPRAEDIEGPGPHRYRTVVHAYRHKEMAPDTPRVG
jgi:tRNA (mo5U34)-methyltransferase